MIDNITTFTESIRVGETQLKEETVSEDNQVWVKFARGMGKIQRPIAKLMAKKLLYTNHELYDEIKILDISASHGWFGLECALINKKATVVGLDWKNVLSVGRENADLSGLSKNFIEKVGDAIKLESYGEKDEYDLVLIPNFVHHFDIRTNVRTFKKAYACLKDTGKMCIVDMIPDDQRMYRNGAIDFATVMLATTKQGDTYTFSEYSNMIQEAGFKGNIYFSDVPLGVAQTIVIVSKK